MTATGDAAAMLSLSAVELHDAFSARELSPVEVAEATLAAAAVADTRLAAISCLAESDALDAAAASGERWARGEPRGRLDGVPITLKDSFHTLGLPRWHGSACHETTISTVDAAPVRRLKEAGAVIVAKTTMPDFAMLMSGLSSRHGLIRNPWDLNTNPGGSSSGAAACLAAGVAPVALGTDMVGSVRVPAALTGLVALCPTRGRIAYDPPATYRSAGPMTRKVADAVWLLETVGRHDGADHFALPGGFHAEDEPLSDLSGMRIGVIADLDYGSTVTTETAAALASQVRLVSELGAEVTEIPSLPVEPADYAAIVALMTHKGALELHSVEPSRRGRLLPEVAAILEPIYDMTALGHGALMARLDRTAARVASVLGAHDYILSPTIPVPSFPVDAVSPDPDLGPMSQMAFVCWFNQIGAPAGSVPVARAGAGVPPISVQVGGRRFDDAGVLRLMALLEERRGFEIDFPVLADA